MDLPGGLINLKAIPIYYESNAYRPTPKELSFIKKIKYNESKTKGLFISKSIDVLNHKALTNFQKFIVDKTEAYVKNILGIKNEIYLTQSWSTSAQKDSFHELHNHPNTFISLVYYAQAKSGNLFFDLRRSSLKECFNFDYSITNYNVYNSEQWTIHIKSRDIVIFPGHIFHGSTPNETKESRITMGANFFIKGKIGREDRISNIQI